MQAQVWDAARYILPAPSAVSPGCFWQSWLGGTIRVALGEADSGACAFAGYWAYGSLLSADGGSFLPSFQANYPNPAGMDGGPRPRWLIIWLLALTCLNALIGIQVSV